MKQQAISLHNLTIKAVLFDLDGTLIDTAPDFIRIITAMCKHKNIGAPSAERIREQVSEGARAMVRLIVPNATQDELEQLREQFLAIYQREIAVETALFAGMDALLVSLENRGIPWGVVTNKPRALAEQLLHKMSLDARCSVLVCPEDVINTKPDPEAMFKAADALNITPMHCVYVGDHPRDIDAGRAASMPTVLAAYGYLPPKQREDLLAWHADYIVENVAGLVTLFGLH